MNSEEVLALESAGWPAVVADAAGEISWANAAAVKCFGGDGASLSRLDLLWGPDNSLTPEHFIAQASSGPAPGLKLRAADGSFFSATASICLFGAAEQARFLIQFLPLPAAGASPTQPHKQKLDCALQLARTVALDFNNALTSILGHASHVLSQMEPNHPWRASLLQVEKSAARAAEIANDLGTFSRQEKDPGTQTAGNLNTVVQHAVEIFKQTDLSAEVDWSLQLESQLFAARFDEAKLQQALLKLVENAVQSLPAKGRIALQTRNLDLVEPTQDRDVKLNRGAYVCIEITDTGCGIPPEILPRIFEPFFTTKNDGKHRGLGLALAYGIVANHGGGIAVSSQAGVGTSARVYLPAENRIVRANGACVDDLKGTQTVLMVDDEELLLTLGQTVLSAYGYSVLTVDSGQKALDLLSSRKAPVDLVITDLVMPGMSGRELVEHLRQVLPETPILCTSGFVRPGGSSEDEAYLQKPFTTQDLLLKVKAMLSN